ncbi:YciI family protein [Nocardia vaccinii]|uniref:YciI family protein n=1 Tax=Nocardia vaccinii TaxID=1822 RepID=UPI0008312C86|nr:YciI family protein [Nocardia vaccinii]
MAIFAVLYTYAEAQAAGRDEHRPAHRAWLNELVEQGTVLTSGPYPDGSGALILVRTDDLAAAQALFAQDPFAKHGLLQEARIVEWKPTMGAFVD